MVIGVRDKIFLGEGIMVIGVRDEIFLGRGRGRVNFSLILYFKPNCQMFYIAVQATVD